MMNKYSSTLGRTRGSEEELVLEEEQVLKEEQGERVLKEELGITK
jgi:hypothetical protein